MFRIAGAQIYRINSHSNCTFQSVRRICVNYGLQLNKLRAEQLKEKKRVEQEAIQREKEMRWTKLYQFTDMKYHSIVTRLKIYPYLSTVILSPFAYIVEWSQQIPEFSALPCLVTGVSGSIVLTAYSKALTNTIGIVYICGQNKNIRIAYIDFWGSQHFIETTVDELHKWEKSPVKFGLYKTVKVIDSNEEKSLKIPWKQGEIFDSKLFRRLFGK